MDAWSRVRGALDRQPPALTASPSGGRLGAALALLGDGGDGDLEFVYTRRRKELANHPGQISFPGGRVEPGEPVEAAALREAVEEVELDPTTATVIGRLPAFYIPPSRFWLQAVVARWDRPHPLVPAEAEVAEVLRVRSSRLFAPDAWRVVRLSTSGWSWAWQLDAEHLLWGATGIATVALLDMIDPDWRRGVQAADLARDREVRPRERDAQLVPRPGPARLPGVPDAPIDSFAVGTPGAPNRTAVSAAGRAVADATAGLLAIDSGRRVLVLAGRGGTGAVGLAAAAVLRRRGLDVGVVLDSPGKTLGKLAAQWVTRLDGAVTTFAGTLPEADVVVDGLVGTGLSGPLAGPARAVAHALRLQTAPVVSIDLPSGLNPKRGLVGDAIAADVTVALGQPSQGLFHPGLSPFVGDLYVADLHDGSLVRLVPAGPGTAG